MDATTTHLAPVDVVVIGAGLAGLCAHHRFGAMGLSLFGCEAAPEVGGTWYWNGYPGARCDVESLDYSYSFSPELLDEWQWSERFATQPEILRYINHVADRFDLRRDIEFSTRLTAARFDDNTNLWCIETDRGHHIQCRFLVATTGALSLPKAPDIPGLDDFTGRWVQTGNWPAEPVDYAGKRVAVIGTGSSGIQCIPIVAQAAARLTVFQRTANYSVPARNGPNHTDHEAHVRSDYPAYKHVLRQTKGGQRSPLNTGLSALDVSDQARADKYEEAWQFGSSSLQAVYRDTTTNPAANALVAAFVHGKIRSLVDDPQVADRLTPRGFPMGTKRLCLDTDYYATFNRANVELVDIRATPIERITATGIRTSAGEYPVDLIIFATGFDAMTGPLLALDLHGAGGVTLRDLWSQGPECYLGLAIAGFPNLFAVNGPTSPSVLTNMIASIEHHVDLIATIITHMRDHGLVRIDVTPQAQDDWAQEVADLADLTLFPQANSWYMGANVPGKPRRFLAYIGGFDRYQARCDAIIADNYKGFRFTPGSPSITEDYP